MASSVIMAQQANSKSKKKLGQNLNKLIPVEAASGVRVPGNGSTANAQGLLVLSTGTKNKQSTSFLQSSAQQLKEQKDNAWGVKQHQSQQQEVDVSVTSPKKEPTATAIPLVNSSASVAESEAATRKMLQQRAMEIKQNEDARQQQQLERAALRLRELEAATALPSKLRSANSTENGTVTAPVVSAAAIAASSPAPAPTKAPAPADTSSNSHQQQHVIHLTSYEDRDRGEKGNSTQPRMLYDPKSGSMVAVKDAAAVAAAKRKTRNTTSKQQPQHPTVMLKREPNTKQPLTTIVSAATTAAVAPKTSTTTSTNKRGGGRKDTVGAGTQTAVHITVTDVVKQQQPDTATAAKRGRNANKRGGNIRNTARSNNNHNAAVALPPTRRNRANRNNNCMSARTSNGRQHEDEDVMYDNSNINSNSYGVALYTGFDPQALKHTGMHQHTYYEEQEELMPVFEVLKADDKIELLTDADHDSPTLKPTAKVFAPSQAALAAALAARSDTDDDDDNDNPFGLGFDPTQDMDGLMQSPIVTNNINNRMHHGDIDFGALKLDPPLNENDSGPRHIFAFGSSGTWGDAAGSSTWDLPVGVKGGGGLFGNGSDAFGEKSKLDTSATNFLNLPTGSAWGGFGGGGGDGISTADKQKTGD